jgi:hypothetical protein
MAQTGPVISYWHWFKRHHQRSCVSGPWGAPATTAAQQVQHLLPPQPRPFGTFASSISSSPEKNGPGKLCWDHGLAEYFVSLQARDGRLRLGPGEPGWLAGPPLLPHHSSSMQPAAPAAARVALQPKAPAALCLGAGLGLGVVVVLVVVAPLGPAVVVVVVPCAGAGCEERGLGQRGREPRAPQPFHSPHPDGKPRGSAAWPSVQRHRTVLLVVLRVVVPSAAVETVSVCMHRGVALLMRERAGVVRAAAGWQLPGAVHAAAAGRAWRRSAPCRWWSP